MSPALRAAVEARLALGPHGALTTGARVDAHGEAWERVFDAIAAGEDVYADVVPGGEMPAPWPGMGVEVVADNGTVRMIVDAVLIDGMWYVLPPGAASRIDYDSEPSRLDEVTAIYDGRRKVWERA